MDLESAVKIFQYQMEFEDNLPVICTSSNVGLAAPEGAYDSFDQNAECISVTAVKADLLASEKHLPSTFMGFPVIVLAI